MIDCTTTPLNDLIDDLHDGDGDVCRRVDFALGTALDLLMDHREGVTAPELVNRAAESVGEAIATLQHYQERLHRLAG